LRKGQMHVIDAVAAVMILFFFAISGFNMSDARDWTRFENQITTGDLSYTMKETGHIDEFVSKGSTGSLKQAFNGITQRDFSTSGDIRGTAPNLDIGFFRRPSQISDAPVSNVSSGDSCDDEVQNQLQSRSATPVLKTEASSIKSNNGDITFYLGDYHINEDLVSQVKYDSVWIDQGGCDFGRLSDPYSLGEIFEWGDGNYYEFRDVDVSVDTWTGTVELAEADQMKRMQETMQSPMNGIKNRVKIDSFTFNDDTEGLDFFIFAEKETLQHIEDEDQRNTVNRMIEDNPVLFMANLNQSLVQNTVLRENGFQWKNLGYRTDEGCGASDQEVNDSCGTLEVGFSSHQDSKKTKEMMSGMKTYFSSISLYPEGSVVTEDKGALSFDKTMYLENFAYSGISEDRVNTGLTEDTSVTGRPDTHCNNITSGTLDFPDSDGNLETLEIVNTQLGKSDSYCSQNNRALYIDRDDDGDFSESDEGPFQEGEKTDIRGLTYVTRIYDSTASGCGPDDCAGFVLDENAQLNVFTYESGGDVGRTPYEDSFSSEDRKAIAGFIYMMAGPTQLEGRTSGEISTSIYGSTGEEPYRINMRWQN